MKDLLIIGGGPAGYAAAERAARHGLSVVLFEKKTLGGVCLNEGCIPTKTMLYSAKMYEHTLQADKYGIQADNVRFDYNKIVARKNKVVRKLVAGIKARMNSPHITMAEGEATIGARHPDGTISITCNGQTHTGRHLLICTGSEALIPPIPGLAEAGNIALTNREILQLDSPPQSLVVIGGGVIGMEFASLFNSFGTKVTVVEMQPEILGANDAELSAMLRTIYAKKGVEFHLNAKVTHVEANRVHFEQDGEHRFAEGEKILVSVGRRATTEGFGLENLGVALHRGAIRVDEQMRTNIPGVFAAGDVTGFSQLAHTASREAEVVVNNLLGHTDTMRYNAIPAVVYTNPEMAAVGETEQSAADKGLACHAVKLPMAYSGRFVAENEGTNGLCKLLVEETSGKIIGLHLLGNPASEIIYGGAMAIERGLTVQDMEQVIFPHPTVGEIWREALAGL